MQVHDANEVKVDGFSTGQVANARAIVQAGQDMHVPPRGWVIAVATAMQESNLHNEANTGVPRSMNLPHEGAGRDHDSVGLFQQRPNPPDGQGSWGTVEELMTPATSARKFYAALLKVNGWATLPLTVAAQRVQRSAFPNAYAKHEAKAAALVGAVSGGADKAAVQPGQCAAPDEVTAGGWVRPVPGEVVSPFGPRGGKLHAGVDLDARKRTPIKAATAGTVIVARCDGSTAAVRPCDQDGSPSVPGCGWFVDLQHADGIITRYCHMIVRPIVAVGQEVAAGQQIGWSGTSGHSSGPHVHFEVHLHGDRSSHGAINPVPFMRDHGAPLGGSA
jgi:murein DD-endopeptidase MepM/ murein hydrolase activator NlpD